MWGYCGSGHIPIAHTMTVTPKQVNCLTKQLLIASHQRPIIRPPTSKGDDYILVIYTNVFCQYFVTRRPSLAWLTNLNPTWVRSSRTSLGCLKWSTRFHTLLEREVSRLGTERTKSHGKSPHPNHSNSNRN